MINLGVIGYGYWGPNIVRNFYNLEYVNILCLCDINSHALDKARHDYPHIKTTDDYRDILYSPSIDVVVVITPVSSHFEIAKKALENNKHVFVEKPFTRTSSEAKKLIELAERQNLKIMVDHTFIFSDPVKKIKEFVESDTIGNFNYYDSMRANFGPFRYDTNVMWDLATHDLSIIDFVLKEKPIAISAHGACYHKNGLEDTAYIIIYFSENKIAHVNVNWLSPVKVRKTIIGGDKKILIWDDLSVNKKIEIYDNFTVVKGKYNRVEINRDKIFKDPLIPNIDSREALKNEVEYTVDCILNDRFPVNSGYSGLRVVGILEAASESLRNSGKIVYL